MDRVVQRSWQAKVHGEDGRTEGLLNPVYDGVLLQHSNALHLWAGGTPLRGHQRLLMERHIVILYQLRRLPVCSPQRLQRCNTRVPAAMP